MTKTFNIFLLSELQEVYRRWVCSTLIPYFAKQHEIKSDSQPQQEEIIEEPTASTKLTTNIDSKAQKIFKQERTMEGSNEIKR